MKSASGKLTELRTVRGQWIVGSGMWDVDGGLV